MARPRFQGPMAICAAVTMRLTQTILLLAALAACAAVGLAVAEAVPWLTLPLTFTDGTVVEAGPGVQVGLAALLVTLCGTMPAGVRVLRLETSHRSFQTSMEDVAHAFYVAHAADRRGVFRIPTEFDAVRERLSFLRHHPGPGRAAAGRPGAGRPDEPYRPRPWPRSIPTRRWPRRASASCSAATRRPAWRPTRSRAMRVTKDIARDLRDVESAEDLASERILELRAELDVLLPRLGLERDGASVAAGPPPPREAGDATRPAIAAVG